MNQLSSHSTNPTPLSASHLTLLVSFLPRHIKDLPFEFKVISSKGSPPALELVKMQDEPNYPLRLQKIYNQCIEGITKRFLFIEEGTSTSEVMKHPVLFFKHDNSRFIFVSYKPPVNKALSAEFVIKLLGDPATTF